MRRPLKAAGLRGGYAVPALVAIFVIAIAVGAVSQRSQIHNLRNTNETLATGKATAIQQRDAAQRSLDAMKRAVDDRAAQNAVHEADEQKIEALRPFGATLFAAQCASCHGREGGGGIGPRISGGVVAQHLTPEAAVAFVSNGALFPMPKFNQSLTPAEIKQVVAYMLTL